MCPSDANPAGGDTHQVWYYLTTRDQFGGFQVGVGQVGVGSKRVITGSEK